MSMPDCPPPLRRTDIASWRVTAESAPEGVWYIRPEPALGKYPAKLTNCLDDWAEREPDRVFLAERSGAGWRRVTYSDFRSQARRMAQGLLDRGLAADRPIAILSGNDIEHALLAMAAMYAGIPYAPVSPAYSLASSSFSRLRHIFDLLQPGLVYASDPAAFERALDAVVQPGMRVVSRADLAEFAAKCAAGALDAAQSRTGPDTIAKVLFTSGSTGVPKGVITTQRMLCSNQEMLRHVFPFLAHDPPVICDWLPWHHTFGGSHNFGLVLYNGGTLYIDGGKPVESAFDETVRNLREVAPTVYFNVPKGYELLVEALTAEDRLREHFFSRLQMAFYAAAGLPQHIWDRFDELAVRTLGGRIPMLTGLGATETAPFALCAGQENRRAGMVGLPVPGVELKLAPVNGKLEARVRGPNVTPGFWREHEMTRVAFDEEGFYRMGDGLRFLDPDDPGRGFVFDGRLAEDFKLSTGTWVSVGPLRAKFLQHCGRLVKDVVIAGHDRDDVTALIFPEPEAYRRLGQNGSMRVEFERLVRDFARQSTGSSNRIARAIVLTDGPSLDAGEITDKGSINQAAVLKNRADVVERLYASPAPADVISGDATGTVVARTRPGSSAS